jgi:hypothetical protein
MKMKANYQNAATTETLLYGCKIGEPNYMEEILYQCKGYTNKQELLSKGQEWAKNNGYDRLRVSVIDLSIAPNFIQAIN